MGFVVERASDLITSMTVSDKGRWERLEALHCKQQRSFEYSEVHRCDSVGRWKHKIDHLERGVETQLKHGK